MPFWARALNKNIFFDIDFVVKTNRNVVYRDLYSYRQRVRVITLFPSNFFALFLHVERVCKSFWKESLRTRTSSYFDVIWIMQSVHFQVRVDIFNCQQILTKNSLVIFDIVVKKTTNRIWFSVVCTLIDNDTRHLHKAMIIILNSYLRFSKILNVTYIPLSHRMFETIFYDNSTNSHAFIG